MPEQNTLGLEKMSCNDFTCIYLFCRVRLCPKDLLQGFCFDLIPLSVSFHHLSVQNQKYQCSPEFFFGVIDFGITATPRWISQRSVT